MAEQLDLAGAASWSPATVEASLLRPGAGRLAGVGPLPRSRPVCRISLPVGPDALRARTVAEYSAGRAESGCGGRGRGRPSRSASLSGYPPAAWGRGTVKPAREVGGMPASVRVGPGPALQDHGVSASGVGVGPSPAGPDAATRGCLRWWRGAGRGPPASLPGPWGCLLAAGVEARGSGCRAGGRGGFWRCTRQGLGWRCCTFILGSRQGRWRHSNVFPPREASGDRMNVQRGHRCTFILVPGPRLAGRSA